MIENKKAKALRLSPFANKSSEKLGAVGLTACF
jgi:hypothetical protein